jgi:hypothetical protein
MANYLCFDSVGNCVQEGSCPDGQEHLQRSDLTTVIHDGNFFNSYLKNGIVKKIPNPPNEFCKFNIQEEKWVVNIEKIKENAKNIRNSLLFQSDWTQTLDAPLTKEKRAEWALYRQKLRDISLQDEFPLNIVWATPPSN